LHAKSGAADHLSRATGDAVRWLQRALRRTPNLGLVVDGNFGSATESAVKEFQIENQ
jgi:peptidoglycan hydrolase-like protein with peptidoglycan-binding domain